MFKIAYFYFVSIKILDVNFYFQYISVLKDMISVALS